jgi:thymidylate kinase
MSDVSLFVAIEGLSGSGKTTIAKLLAAKLDAHYYKTPPAMFLPIRSHVEQSATELARHLYYYAGIAQASAEIGRLLKERAVVCDKYVATMLAYSRAAGIPVDAPSNLILQPDYAFLIDVPDDLRLQRLRLRGSIPEWHQAFLEAENARLVTDMYRSLRVRTVDNTADVTVAISTIVRHLDDECGARTAASD